MILAIFDTNIIIDYLESGNSKAEKELEKFSNRAISLITYIELLAGIKRPEAQLTMRKYLEENFKVMKVTDDIAEETIVIRRNNKLKLPDSIILATAIVNNALLVTRDKSFDREMPTIRVPY